MRPPAALDAALRGAAQRLRRNLLAPPLPLLAVEVRPTALSAVRLAVERGRLGLAAAASVDLQPGTLDVSLTRPNVLDPTAFGVALRSLLERVGGSDGGPVSLVLPDSALRLALIAAEGVRGRGREAREVVRFRMHKALPFEVRGARLAWEAAASGQILVAVAPEEVVGGYEQALASLGHHAGLVEAASLALTELLPERGDNMLVNWEQGYVSFVIRRGAQVLLVRTLPGEDAADSVARQTVSTLQFYRDRLGGGTLDEVLLRSAALPGDVAAGIVGQALERRPRLVAPWTAIGGSDDGDAAQGVAGAAACVLRRAA